MRDRRIISCIVILSILFAFPANAENERQEDSQMMIAQIERTHMSDGGFRHPNYFFSNLGDPYATYYLRCIKQMVGLENSVELADITYSMKRLSGMESNQWNLMDVYSLVMLTEDLEHLNKELYDSIIAYLHGLYDEENGCYQWSTQFTVQQTIAPTYYAVKSLEKLDQTPKPIDEWVARTAANAFEMDAKMEEDYGGYSMLYDLMQDNKIPIDSSAFDSVIDFYHSVLLDEKNNEGMVSAYDKGDIPIIAEDCLNLCKKMGKLNAYQEDATNLFVNRESCHKYFFWEYDYVNLYAITSVLSQSPSFTEAKTWLSDEIAVFDQFLLDNGEYISPMICESSIDSTYYADKLLGLLDNPVELDMEGYCRAVIDKGMNLEQLGIERLGQFIELLQKYHVNLNDEVFTDYMEEYLEGQWESVYTSKDWNLSELTRLNQLLSLFQTLRYTYGIEPAVQENIKETVWLHLNERNCYQDDIYLLAEYVKFLLITGEDNRGLITQLCEWMNQLLEQLGTQGGEFKVLLAFNAVESLNKAGYPVSDTAKQAIQNMLTGAYWRNGFYRTGDADDEKVTYEATYKAAYLLIELYQEVK